MAKNSDGIEPRKEPTRIGGIDYPDEVIRALLERRLVVFAGAGVSMACPSHLPSFRGLIEQFEHLSGRRQGESYDQYLGRNDIEHGVNVHGVVEKILNQGVPLPNSNHLNLLRLFGSAHDVRLVTTNFDSMFEQACGPLGWGVESFTAPLLPSATDFRGIVHLHGSLEDTSRMVLTDTDLGRAYLSEGWAARFLSELVRRYTVLFVGYSSNDLMPRYLLSAIRDASAGKLYMLHPSGEQQNLEQIGIKSIPYRQDSPTDHSVLAGSLARLGTLFSQDSDEWRSLIEVTVASADPVTQSAEEVIRLALRMPATTRYFVNATDNVTWVRWLDANGYLSPVFTTGVKPQTVEFLTVNDNLSTQFETSAQRRSVGLLAALVARQCIRDAPAYLLSLLERHDLEMSDQLWQQLVYAIRDNDPTEVSLVQWLTILLQHPIEHMEHDALYALAGSRHQQTDAEALLFMYEFLIAPRWIGSQRDWHGTDAHVKITENMVGRSNASSALHHCANMFDDQSVAVLKRGLEIGIKSFVRRHELLKAWCKASDDFDEWSTWFNPFNPQVAPDQPEGFELVFYIIRRQIHSLVNSDRHYANELVGRLADSPVPILRRLAVDAVIVRGDLDDEDKVEWLIEHAKVEDRELVSEVSRLLTEIFRGARAETQSKLVDWLMSGEDCRSPKIKDRMASKAHWIKLLESADPNSEAVARESAKLSRQEPEVLDTPYPERPFQIIESGRIDHPTPYTVHELLAKPAAEWIEDLVAWRYPGKWLWSDERFGLRTNVRLACAQDFDWSLELATQLAARNELASDLWLPLVQAWMSEGCSVSDWTSVLSFVNELVGREDTSVGVARILTKFANCGTNPDDFDVAGKLAATIWEAHAQQADRTGDDYVTASLNSVAGRVPEYWAVLAYRVGRCDLPDTAFFPNGKQWLSRLARSSSEHAAVAKVTVGCRLGIFFQLDREWVAADLLPMFGSSHHGFARAWEGFLLSFRDTGWIPEELFAYVGHALTNRDQIQALLSGNMAGLVAFLCCNRIDSRNYEFVKTVFNTANDIDQLKRDIRDFTSGLRTCLRRHNAERLKMIWDSWLKEYLSRRRNGLPSGLVEGEVWELLMFIPVMLPAASEILDVLIDFPIDVSESNNFGDVFHSVDVDDFPNEYAKLMLYFDEYKLGSWQWNYNKKHIDKLIANEAVPLDQRKRLQDLKFKHMID